MTETMESKHLARLQALEAVAEAARSALYVSPGAIVRLADALDALDALPADPAPAEMGEVAVWEGMTGLIEYVKAGSIRDQQEAFGPLWRRVGTTRFPLVKEDKS